MQTLPPQPGPCHRLLADVAQTLVFWEEVGQFPLVPSSPVLLTSAPLAPLPQPSQMLQSYNETTVVTPWPKLGSGFEDND